MNRLIIIINTFLKISFCFYWLLIPLLSLAQEEINPNGFNVFYYPNGKKSSEGNFKNGKPEGYWKTYYENGSLKSEGNRINHRLDSLWLFYNSDGTLKQEIMYRDAVKHGVQKNYNQEGLLVSLERFRNDTLNGFMEYYDPDSQHLNELKPFENGRAVGKGYEFAKDGRVVTIVNYEAGYVKDRETVNKKDAKGLKQGRWVEFYEDEPGFLVRLEGRYKDDLKNGYFREYDKKGLLLTTTKYVNGEVMENVEELMAVDIERDFHPNAQVKHERTYLGGVPHGVWKEYNDTGAVVNSQIYKQGILLGEGVIDAQGIKQGFWKEFYNTGELRAEGEYLDGARYSDWKFYHINGNLEQKGKYREGGLEQGEWRWYYDDKKLRRIEFYSKGKEDGEVIEYDKEGKELLTGSYFEGLEDGEWMIRSGEYRETGKYTEGLKQDEWIHYFLDTDEVAFEGTYTEGLPDGKHVYYYDNGKKMLEGKYQMGLKQGDWKRFNEEGILLLTIKYKDGATVKLDGRKVKPEE